MSTTVIVHQAAFKLPLKTVEGKELFVVVAQVGDSNCFEAGLDGRCGRMARAWQSMFFGTAESIMCDAIRYSSDFEGGMVRMSGEKATPEKYIARVRRQLAKAESLAVHTDGYFRAAFRSGTIFMWLAQFENKEIIYPADQAGLSDFLIDAEKGRWFEGYSFNYLTVNGPSHP
ncbi:hypothetical protein LP417_35100 (plasmid) [Polaromonas sp. P1-6]|nr:hypothetical protein LP417_35100 [Polaromonas sp. P1-6]